MKYLPLTFSAVLQHYTSTNFSSVKGSYYCSDRPTKSAVIGLIASAIGLERGSAEIDRLYNSLSVKCRTVKSGSFITDFQTIRPLKSQNYMSKYIRNTFISVKGDYLNKPAEVKKIQYLQDAEFEVFVGADEETLKKIYDAIQNPCYALYFGKRSCVPNKPIVTEFKLVEELNNVHDCA